MPTKRTRRTRNIQAGVTDEAVHHFREALKYQGRYDACLYGEIACLQSNVHCPECAAYLEHTRALKRELRRAPWEADPLTHDCPAREELMRRSQ